MDGHGVMTCCRGDGPVALWMPRGASAITLALAAMEVPLGMGDEHGTASQPILTKLAGKNIQVLKCLEYKLYKFINL